jgi:DtxR family Mn-dependent transcriptional regulator
MIKTPSGMGKKSYPGSPNNRSTEDYIKAVFTLMTETDRVATSAIAAELRLSDASVTGMVKKLAAKGLVRYERYRGVGLTEEGRRLALRILRRHRLWELFLVSFLKYPWELVHDEAERLEHATSDELEQRLDRLLGHPPVDPHGDPIPTAAGELTAGKGMPLSGCSPGSIVVVSRVSDRDPAVLQHAAKLGLSLRARVLVLEKTPADGSLVVRVGSRKKYISNQLAGVIMVEHA